jgi:hypothetical protein
MARLDRAPRLREVAQLGSVLGREFAYDMISALAGLERRAGVWCRGAVAHRLSR